nr:hypothetical protein [Tanacetum cinerariifolium]
MVRDSVQLETSVNTISHKYLLEFTSEYGISEMLHPELPGPGDKIVDFPEGKVDECVFPTAVDWRTNASKDGMPTNGTYSVKAMDEPAAATDSSGVPSTIERSPLDLAHEAEASGRETAAPEMPPPEDVPVTTAPGTDQAVETVVVEPSAVRESRKRGYEGIDTNAPPKSLRRDHDDLRPSGSSRGGKSLAAMQLCLAFNVFVSEGFPADVSDPYPLAFADAPSPHPTDV